MQSDPAILEEAVLDYQQSKAIDLQNMRRYFEGLALEDAVRYSSSGTQNGGKINGHHDNLSD